MGIKIICKNKRASFDFFLDEKWEAGLQLQGTEVKSIREGKVSLSEAYVGFGPNQELWLYNMYVAQYNFGNRFNHEENRKRKLLLHKKELEKIYHEMKVGQKTMVPTILYFKGSKIKLEFALAKGKKLHDKRADSAKKDVERKLRQGDFN